MEASAKAGNIFFFFGGGETPVSIGLAWAARQQSIFAVGSDSDWFLNFELFHLQYVLVIAVWGCLRAVLGLELQAGN